MEFNILKAADLGQIPDSVSEANNFLPKEVSAKIVEEIVAANIMRQYVQKITVANRSLSIPRVNYGDTVNAYKIGYGVDVRDGRSETGFSSKATVLEPQLLAAFTNILEVDLDTAGLDLSNYIRKSLALTIARAEEKAMLVGVAGSGSGYATMFDGVYTIASGAGCAQVPVEYADEDSLVDAISDAIKAQGVYGEDRGQLVLVAANSFANALRKDPKVQQVGTYNVAELGVTRSGSLPLIHGVKIIESSVLESQEAGECAVLMRMDGGILGERGQIIFRKKAIEEAFMMLLIMAEVIDFKWTLYNSADKATGLTLIHKATS
jgi:hypothetical protein